MDLQYLTSLDSVYLSGIVNALVVLPCSDLSYLYFAFSVPYFSSGTGVISTFVLDSLAYVSDELVQDSILSFENVDSFSFVNIRKTKGKTLSFLNSYDVSFSVSELKLGLSDSENSYSVDALSTLEGLSAFASDCTTLSVVNNPYVTDFNELENFSSLTTLSICDTCLSDISFLNDLTNLEKLTFNDNSISKLHPLQYLMNLTYLNLKNNAIYDTAEDDEGNTYNNLEILIRLNSSYTGEDTLNGSLSTLYISGNKLTLDSTNTAYTTLLGLSWTDKDF